MLLFFTLFAIFSVSNSLNLECKFDNNFWVITGPLYTCAGTAVSTDETFNVTKVSNSHLQGKKNSDVNGFFIFTQPITRMPSNINKFFSNIRAIHLKETKINQLTIEDLRPFPKLEVFACWHSEIETLDGDVFKYNTLLQHLNLNNNLITNIGPNLLTPLSILHQFSIESNLCTNEAARSAEGVALISKKLRFQCPPSPAMIEKIILGGDDLQRKIESCDKICIPVYIKV